MLTPASSWHEISAEASDWESFDPAALQTMLCDMHLIRAFEEKVVELSAEGLMHGPAHTSIGQEGAAVASSLDLRPSDQVNGSHRGHHQFLAKALRYIGSANLILAKEAGHETRHLVRRTLAEIMGLAPGFCGGRGGSMHLRWRDAGALGTNAIVGGGVPLAAGAAWAQKAAGTDNVVITYFGDGAVNIGSVLETMNLAAAWKLPLCFFIENNGYAVATRVDEVTAEPRLSARGLAFNIPAWRVDGMDPLSTALATREALAHMRSGAGPTIIEASVYRYLHQSGALPGSAFGYRTKDEEEQWRARDPLLLLAREMIGRSIVRLDEVDTLRARCVALVETSANGLTEPSNTNRRTVQVAHWPLASSHDEGIRSSLSELAGLQVVEESAFVGACDRRRFVDVIANVIGRRMEMDPRIIVLGEDIHRLKGGTNGATRGLAERFPDRVLGTPICEGAFLGLAGGAAIDGRYRPIVEFMYPDFMWVAADQIFNQIGKVRHMFGGTASAPLVLRTKVAMGTGYGSQHSMDPAGVFATAPGWRIAAPSTAFDYIGVMNAAVAMDDPVLVIEHVDLYQTMQLAPIDNLDYILPPGTAAVRRAGKRATVLTYLSMVTVALAAAEALDADVEIIDLRWLDRASFDWDTVGGSIVKTNNVLIIEQGCLGTSYGGWLADEIQRRYFDWLDAPISRVTGGEASPSISKILERAAVAGREEIETALVETLRYAS